MTKKVSEYFMACEATKVFAIRKMKMLFKNKNTHSLRTDILQKHAVRLEAPFYWGAENEGRRPAEIFRVSEMPFPGLWGSFDAILMVRKQRFSMSKFTICLQFSSTKWAKAYLINYLLEKLQESMGNMILCSLSCMDNVAA